MSKSRFKWRQRVMEINTRLTEMVDLIEKEKRELTSSEKEEKTALVSEKEILQLRMAREDNGYTASETQASKERAFANIAFAIVKRTAIPDDCKGIVDNNEIILPRTRATSGIQDTSTTSPLIPLTIGDIIPPLEKGLILDKVGIKMQYGLVGDWALPVVGAVEASIEGENTEVADTTIDISKLSPSPKRVAITIPVSNRAIDQSNDALLDIVNTQLTAGVTRLLNKWMFSPVKIASKASNGCFVEAVQKPIITSKTSSFTLKEVNALKIAVMSKGVVFDGTGAYVCSAATYGELETTPRDAGSGQMILENGKIGGFPVFVTEYVGEDVLGFGVFSYELLGQFGEVRIIVDPYTKATNNIVRFTLNTDFDMLTIRPEAFAVGKRTLAEEEVKGTK